MNATTDNGQNGFHKFFVVMDPSELQMGEVVKNLEGIEQSESLKLTRHIFALYSHEAKIPSEIEDLLFQGDGGHRLSPLPLVCVVAADKGWSFQHPELDDKNLAKFFSGISFGRNYSS